MTKVTTGDLLAALEEYGRQKPKRPPGAGWMTVLQVATQKKVSVSRIRQQLQTAATNGLKIERFQGSDYDESGNLVKQTWFRVKPK